MLLCLLSGVLTGLTFVFKDFCFLNIITLIPFFIGVKEPKYAFLKGFCYFAALNAVTMSFFYKMHPMEFMGLTGVGSICLVALMHLGVILFEGVMGGILVMFFLRFIKNIWIFPLWYTLAEIILSIGKFGLTLSHLYLPWYKMLPFIQSAAYFSGYFITFLIVLLNFLLYKLWETRQLKYLVIAVALFSVNTLFGALRIGLCDNDPFEYEMALVQGNISSLDKWGPNSTEDSLKVYESLSKEAEEKYDVSGIIWPETVIVTPISEKSSLYQRVSHFCDTINTDIYIGAFYSEADGYYNALIGFDEDGKGYSQKYYKRHLIPFAEDSFERGYGLKEGNEATLINTKNGKIGPLICIDSAYPYLAYRTCREEPDYLLVISNDSWFTDSFGVESHFAHSVFRAIENNKYLLRTGNTGITAVITPKGEVKGKIEPLKRGYTVIKKGEVYREEK